MKNLPHMMPSPEVFAKYASMKGIGRDTHVVCYDSLGVFSSPRAVFTFKAFGHENVSLLNGGLPAWIEQGYELSLGPIEEQDIKTEQEAYPAPDKVQDGWVRSFEEVRANSKMGPRSQTVLDARPKPR